MRGAVFPFTVAGLILLSLVTNLRDPSRLLEALPGVMIAFAEEYYGLIFLVACSFVMRESSAPPLRMTATGFLLFELGTLIGRVAGFAIDAMVRDSSAVALHFIMLFVFATLCVGIFWIGDDDTLRKWWGLRVNLSPKERHDELVRAKCRYLAERFALSQREGEILLMIAEGKRASQIEQECFISIHTVRNHIHSVYRKLGVHSFKDLVSLMESVRVGDDEL